MKILIAEDDEDIRSLLREVLEGEGHQCEVAANGEDAMRLFERGNQFELLISDYRMPRADGIGLIRWCREKQIQLPVIFLSASRIALSPDSIALKEGRAEFLRKPVDMDDLLRAVNNCA
jgi:CheY-like chemotaxis protein